LVFCISIFVFTFAAGVQQHSLREPLPPPTFRATQQLVISD